ncbi:nuclease [Pseudalkalibacillus hwajinpoensis]|uniref:nuclease n=1 Tax=Guptibacillus hwajinpoensis TaxID=208199 RepID=UPI001CD4EB3D|nr:nuclease [Pseudalkalibacillus hwajinpoensis]MCA0992966.1 nuclease [Pseudalkalibacillus hwajinpoensis]
MNNPPISKDALTDPSKLCEILTPLIGEKFPLSKVTRTDGSNMRRRIECILENNGVPCKAPQDSFSIIPPRRKGVPKITREFLDSYIVTSGKNYNLQVWNRNPSIDSVQIEYVNSPPLMTSDSRFVLTKVNTVSHEIESITIMTGDHIVKNFGKFGKPTVKQQLIISQFKRDKILSNENSILFYPDDKEVSGVISDTVNLSNSSIRDNPVAGQILSLEKIKEIVQNKIIGTTLDNLSTKNRGQALEYLIAKELGYNIKEGDPLEGGYPDIRNQVLEVKVQDSQTVDLGKYSPEFPEDINTGTNLGFTTYNARYLIALTDPQTGEVKGAVLCPGYKLGEHFTYVGEESYKCQRSIPMDFFNNHKGQVVFNPPYSK